MSNKIKGNPMELFFKVNSAFRALLAFVTLTLLSSCTTVEPVVLPTGHPANASATGLDQRNDAATLRDYSLPEPRHPLADTPADDSAMHHNHAELDHGAVGSGRGPDDRSDAYTCPMHPEIVSETEGRCPICEMNLERSSKAAIESKP